MSLRIGLRPLLACAAFFTAAQVMPAQLKMAVINFQTAVYGTAEIKKAGADMDAKYKPRDDEITKLNTQLVDIQKKIQTGEDTLPPDQLSNLQAQGTKIQRDLQRKQEDRQADFERINGIIWRSQEDGSAQEAGRRTRARSGG